MPSIVDIAWAAGLFEGEGSITHYYRTKDSTDVRVSLTMTDEDVVRRFDEIVERGKVYGPYLPFRDRGHKPRWNWVALGDAAHDVLDLIGPWLGNRRLAQALRQGVVLGPYC